MHVRALFLVAVATLVFSGPARPETRVGDNVLVSDLVDDDLYAAGGEVRIDGSVAGDAVIGAGTAAVPGDIEGDAIIAGGRIAIEGGVGDDLRAAGGDVAIRGFVTDHATIAGGTVTLAEGSAIAGRTWIAAGTLEMAGQIGDDLRVAAGTAVISGRVAGNVYVTARRIRVAPGAVIGGDLIWRSDQPPAIAENAQILGDVVSASEPVRAGPRPEVGGFALGTAIFVAAAMLLWLGPQFVQRSATIFRAAPGRTLALGAAILLLAPVVAVILFVTVLGWLLGLLVLVGYFFALVLAGLLGLLMVVQVLRSQFSGPAAGRDGVGGGGWRSIVLLAFVTAATIVLQPVPILGSLLTLLLVLAGFGALAALLTGRGGSQPDTPRPQPPVPGALPPAGLR